MVGLPNTTVIHPDFQSHHRATLDHTMTATCVITRPASDGTPPFNEATATSVHPAATTVYTGICRIQHSGDPAGPEVVADRDATNAGYTVSVPADADLIQVGDLATVTACTHDPDLVGLVLHVINARRGSVAWQRDLACQLRPPTTR